MITEQVLILRLSTGEDIVGTTTTTNTDYHIHTPFKVIFRRLTKTSVGLSAIPWLPDEILDDHNITLSKTQVVCTMIPKQEFVDYYHRTIDEFYMSMVKLDTSYRKQLELLEKHPSPDTVKKSLSRHYQEMFDRMSSSEEGTSFPDVDDEEEEGDEYDNGPIFH